MTSIVDYTERFYNRQRIRSALGYRADAVCSACPTNCFPKLICHDSLLIRTRFKWEIPLCH